MKTIIKNKTYNFCQFILTLKCGPASPGHSCKYDVVSPQLCRRRRRRRRPLNTICPEVAHSDVISFASPLCHLILQQFTDMFLHSDLLQLASLVHVQIVLFQMTNLLSILSVGNIGLFFF